MSLLKDKPSLIAGITVGVLLTLALTALMTPDKTSTAETQAGEEKKPLYWVAPMDSNYRRDKPGQSPMGMDLIPVYAEDESSGGPGSIKISPEVVNNLGVRVSKAELKPLNSQVQTVGYVQYDQDQLVHVHPRVDGWIEQLHIKAEGDPVVKGQPLYDIYSPALVNAQEELLLALERKNSRLIKAAKERLGALQLPQQSISQLERTRQVTQTVRFFAPIDGVVDNLNIRQGFYVQPGNTLMSIGNLQQVWVEAEIFERQAFIVNQGDKVSMTLDYIPGREWQGKVDYVYPTLDAANRTVKLRLRFDNPDLQLKPNMFAQVVIKPAEDPVLLVVPSEAVIRTGSQDRVVLALGQGRFKSVEVKVGKRYGEYSEIIDGLQEGEAVVTSAQFLLDSESSKNSDFKRMLPPDGHQMMSASIQTARVSGRVNQIDTAANIVNISRGPIEKWQRPAATLDFMLSDDLSGTELKPGSKIDFTFEIRGEAFVVIKIHQE